MNFLNEAGYVSGSSQRRRGASEGFSCILGVTKGSAVHIMISVVVPLYKCEVLMLPINLHSGWHRFFSEVSLASFWCKALFLSFFDELVRTGWRPDEIWETTIYEFFTADSLNDSTNSGESVSSPFSFKISIGLKEFPCTKCPHVSFFTSVRSLLLWVCSYDDESLFVDRSKTHNG